MKIGVWTIYRNSETKLREMATQYEIEQSFKQIATQNFCLVYILYLIRAKLSWNFTSTMDFRLRNREMFFTRIVLFTLIF